MLGTVEAEVTLNQLSSLYDAISHDALVAKAEFLAMADTPGISLLAISRARAAWQRLEKRLAAIQNELETLENSSDY